MKISWVKMFWCGVTGGGGKVADYLFGLGNQALRSLGAPTKEKIQAVLNFLKKLLSVLKAVQLFLPVKWQTAYAVTMEALEQIVEALSDLEVTGEELNRAVAAYSAAYLAWTGPDDETCVAP